MTIATIEAGKLDRMRMALALIAHGREPARYDGARRIRGRRLSRRNMRELAEDALRRIEQRD